MVAVAAQPEVVRFDAPQPISWRGFSILTDPPTGFQTVPSRAAAPRDPRFHFFGTPKLPIFALRISRPATERTPHSLCRMQCQVTMKSRSVPVKKAKAKRCSSGESPKTRDSIAQINKIKPWAIKKPSLGRSAPAKAPRTTPARLTELATPTSRSAKKSSSPCIQKNDHKTPEAAPTALWVNVNETDRESLAVGKVVPFVSYIRCIAKVK